MKEAIIVFSSNTENWGAERSVCSMCDALQRRGKKVVVIIPKNGPIECLLNDIKVEYYVMPFTNWHYLNSRALRPDVFLKSIYREYKTANRIRNRVISLGYKPVLVYSSVILTGIGLYCSKKWGVPHVHHFRENIDAFGYKMKYGYRNTMKYIRKHTDWIICTCNAVKERYIYDIDEDRVSVINNGVPVAELVPNRNVDGCIRIVHVARFMDDKRIIDSLQAVKILKDRGYKDFQLDLYGQGPELSMYEKFIKENDIDSLVAIVGFVPSIDYSPYHIGIMASTFEAFARTTLDYMNNGLAVVASNTGGNLEQVIDGETGLFFNVKNPSSMADKIEYLINNRDVITKMGKAGRKHFLSSFTQEIYQEKISSLLISFTK